MTNNKTQSLDLIPAFRLVYFNRDKNLLLQIWFLGYIVDVWIIRKTVDYTNRQFIKLKYK